MSRLEFLTREGCPLCEEFWLDLSLDLGPDAEGIALVDIDADPVLAVQYGLRLPVLLVNGEVVCEGRYDPARVRAALQV